MSNICFLLYDFSQMGGAERAIAKLVNELVSRHNITVISVFNKKEVLPYDVDQRVSIIKIIDGAGHILRNINYISGRVRQVIKQENIECLFSVDVATALIGVLGTRFTKAKLVMCDRSSCYNEDMYSMLNLRVYAWLGIHFCDKYQVMTEEGKKGCLEKYCVRQEKIVVIPNWLDESAIKNNEYEHSNNKIITVGRATPEKNYEVLVQIAKRIKPYCKGWQWHIWGNFENEYGMTLLNLIKKEKLDNFLICKGVSDRIYDIYEEYSFFVMTSRFEGMPNVLLEARGSKLPVLAFDCKTGPSELIQDGVNGYLIPLNNVDMMCERIEELIANSDLANSFSENWHIGMERYSKTEVLQKWNDLIEDMKVNL